MNWISNKFTAQLLPLYFAYLISQLGNWMFRAGVVYEIYDKQGGSSSLLGWTVMLVYIPILLGGKWLAPYADQSSARKILIGLDLFRSILLLPLVLYADLSELNHVFLALVVIVFLSASTPLFSAAQSAYIRRTVDKERVASTMAIISNIDWFTILSGTIFGSLLLLAFDFQSIVMIDIITFLVSLVIIGIFLKPDVKPASTVEQSGHGEETRSHQTKVGLVLLAIFLLNLGAGVINLYPNIVARNVYHTEEIGLSYVYLGNGIGGFLGAMLVLQIRKRMKPILMISTASLFIAISLYGMSIFSGMTLSVVSSSTMLLFGQIFGVGVHSYLLTVFPVNQAGRITGLFMFATFSGVAGNALLFSGLQSNFDIQSFSRFLIFCAVSALFSLLFLLIYEFRNRRTDPKSKFEEKGNAASF